MGSYCRRNYTRQFFCQSVQGFGGSDPPKFWYLHRIGWSILQQFISARCNMYISRLCYDVSVRLSVRLSVTEVHWRIIANLGFKFRSHFTVLLAGGSSRAMLASARSLVSTAVLHCDTPIRVSYGIHLAICYQCLRVCEHWTTCMPLQSVIAACPVPCCRMSCVIISFFSTKLYLR